MLTFVTKKLSTGANGQKEDAGSFFCPRSFDRAVMVAQWSDLRLETLETRVQILPWANSGHVTTRSMSPQHLHSPMLTFVTKKLSTGANGQKEDAGSFFCPRSFDRAVMESRVSFNFTLTPFSQTPLSLSHQSFAPAGRRDSFPQVLSLQGRTWRQQVSADLAGPGRTAARPPPQTPATRPVPAAIHTVPRMAGPELFDQRLF